MSQTTIDIEELATRFDEILSLAYGGEEIIVTDGNAPKAKLVPIKSDQHRVAGLHKGAIQTTADFDAPLSDEFWLGK